LSLGVTGNCLVIGIYWKFSGDWELLEVFWWLGVTESFLFIGSYWKLSVHWELLEVFWSLRVTRIVLQVAWHLWFTAD
jgi:hypothetical protein